VKLALEEMQREGAHEVVLETEVSNSVAMSLYESLGFLRDKRLHRSAYHFSPFCYLWKDRRIKAGFFFLSAGTI
jgi:ribosomal protein S18 acetylase RimI-like enzyme